MFTLKQYNNISDKGLAQLPSELYQFTGDDPDAILLRSHKLHDMTINSKLKVVARAGAGTNNIPVDRLQAVGIPVLNTPGANANAVKELVIGALFLASRNLCQAWQMTKQLTGADIDTQVESLKKQFCGSELPGKKLGVIGLGAIGVQVANTAQALGMNVIAYDPHITVQNAWQLSPRISYSDPLEGILSELDFVTVHVPLNEQTKSLLNFELLQKLPKHCVVLNFSRGGVVDTDAILTLLNQNLLGTYITDFPSAELLASNKVIALPHLGASTLEAEDNCALMAVNNLREYLELGNIRHSVNFPNISLAKPKGHRITIANKNIPNMVSQISNILGREKLNILDMINKSRDDIAYTILDVDKPVTPEIISTLSTTDGVIRCRLIS